MAEERGRRVRPADVPLHKSPSGLPTQYLAWRETGMHQLFVGQQWLGQGQRVFLHTHSVEEVLMFLSGRGIARLGDDEFQVVAGDSVVVPAGIVHGFRNDDPEPLRVLVIFPGNDFARTDFVEPTHDQSALHPASLPGLPEEMVNRSFSDVRTSGDAPKETSSMRQQSVASVAPSTTMDTVALLAEVWRGERVESAHVGVAVVADAQGNVIASAGDPDHFAYYRSSAKPFQAVPLVESGAADAFGLTERELALCCASHAGEPHHQAEVLGLLRKIGLDERALQCGVSLPSDRREAARVTLNPTERSPLQCDCSGKHAGILATCQHLGEPIDTYLELAHSAQQRILAVMADALDVPVEEIAIATDGCSLPTFGSTMRAFARSWAVLADPAKAAGPVAKHADALARLRDAMMAVPENVAGEGKLVTELMRAGKGTIVAKSGAEGLLCLGLPERGLGIAIRVWDGSFRSHAMLALSVLRQLDALTPDVEDAILAKYPPVIRNHNGWPVGEIRPVLQLE